MSLAIVFGCVPARAIGAQSAAPLPPVLTAFGINDGADTISASAPTVSLVHKVVGTPPSEYRVVRRSHRVTLYFQVRANVGEEVRIIDGQRQLVPARVESNVLRATVCARPAGA
jgi:hypothetical protein